MTTGYFDLPDEVDEIGRRAMEWYDKLRAEIDTEENFGKYACVDSETGEYVIGSDEFEAERNFIARYSSDRKAVLFRIGRF